MTGKRWDTEATEVLKIMWPRKSGAQIKDILNQRFGASYSRQAVIARANRLGLKKSGGSGYEITLVDLREKKRLSSNNIITST